MYFRKLETLATRYVVVTTVLLVVIVCALLAMAVQGLGYSVDTVGKVVDAVVKATALVVGGVWALNRYFTQRTDVLQLRVDPLVEFVADTATGSDLVMLCRLDTVNTGKSLTSPYDVSLLIEGAVPASNPTAYVRIDRWPTTGSHRSGPIEPGSWGAVSMATRVPKTTKFVRVFLELKFDANATWTWHRHFVVKEATA
jgi:hypothetical protein